jgi:hypothetical protein
MKLVYTTFFSFLAFLILAVSAPAVADVGVTTPADAPPEAYSVLEQALGLRAREIVLGDILIVDAVDREIEHLAGQGRFWMYHPAEKVVTRVARDSESPIRLRTGDLQSERTKPGNSAVVLEAIEKRLNTIPNDKEWRAQLTTSARHTAHSEIEKQLQLQQAPLAPPIVPSRPLSNSTPTSGSAVSPQLSAAPEVKVEPDKGAYQLPTELSEYIVDLAKEAVADGLAEIVGKIPVLGVTVFFESPEDLANALISAGLQKVIGAGATAGLTLFFDSSEVVSQEEEMTALWKAKSAALAKQQAASHGTSVEAGSRNSGDGRGGPERDRPSSFGSGTSAGSTRSDPGPAGPAEPPSHDSRSDPAPHSSDFNPGEGVEIHGPH